MYVIIFYFYFKLCKHKIVLWPKQIDYNVQVYEKNKGRKNGENGEQSEARKC